MHPQKAKEYISDVADELKISEEAIDAVISFYWQEVRKQLSALSTPRIHLTNLGDFVIKHWNIDDKIKQLELFEERNRQKGLQQMTARFKTAEHLFKLKGMKKMVEEENQRKDFIKLHKTKQYELGKKHTDNLEEQGTDSGGDNK